MDECVIMTNTSLSLYQILCTCTEKIQGGCPCNVYQSTVEVEFVLYDWLLFFSSHQQILLLN